MAWAADPIDLFFVEIQGSGRLKAPDGTIMRIGYDNQNGRDYVAVGRLLRDRGILPSGGITRDVIINWMRAQPDGGKALMRENLSYIFFKELTGPGPIRAMNIAVTPQVTVAADPLFAPLGAPVFIDMDRSRRPVGGAGHGRSDQGSQPLRHLLGRRRSRRTDGGRHVGQRHSPDSTAQGQRRAHRGGRCADYPLKSRPSGPK